MSSPGASVGLAQRFPRASSARASSGSRSRRRRVGGAQSGPEVTRCLGTRGRWPRRRKTCRPAGSARPGSPPGEVTVSLCFAARLWRRRLSNAAWFTPFPVSCECARRPFCPHPRTGTASRLTHRGSRAHDFASLPASAARPILHTGLHRLVPLSSKDSCPPSFSVEPRSSLPPQPVLR